MDWLARIQSFTYCILSQRRWRRTKQEPSLIPMEESNGCENEEEDDWLNQVYSRTGPPKPRGIHNRTLNFLRAERFGDDAFWDQFFLRKEEWKLSLACCKYWMVPCVSSKNFLYDAEGGERYSRARVWPLQLIIRRVRSECADLYWWKHGERLISYNKVIDGT